MLASCPLPSGPASTQQEDQGSCDEMEDFVKSFIPSLFDSDSDTEEGSFLLSDATLDSAVAVPKVSRTLHLPMRRSANTVFAGDSSLETSSPSSQGNCSSLSASQPAALESSVSADEQSTFQSVLSIASSTTVFDAFVEEERPAKKAKLAKSLPLRCSSGPSRQPEKGGELPAPAAAPSLESCPSGKPGGLTVKSALPRPSSLLCLTPKPVAAVPPTGCREEAPPPPQLASAAPPQPPVAAPWSYSSLPPPTQPSPRCRSFPPPLGEWPGMIPTAPMTAFVPQLQRGVIGPAAAAEKEDSVSATLAELRDAATANPPLGLKLDKLDVLRQLKTMDMAANRPCWAGSGACGGADQST